MNAGLPGFRTCGSPAMPPCSLLKTCPLGCPLPKRMLMVILGTRDERLQSQEPQSPWQHVLPLTSCSSMLHAGVGRCGSSLLSLPLLFGSFSGLIFLSSPSFLLAYLSGPDSQLPLSYLPGSWGGMYLSPPLFPIIPSARMQEAELAQLPGVTDASCCPHQLL